MTNKQSMVMMMHGGGFFDFFNNFNIFGRKQKTNQEPGGFFKSIFWFRPRPRPHSPSPPVKTPSIDYEKINAQDEIERAFNKGIVREKQEKQERQKQEQEQKRQEQEQKRQEQEPRFQFDWSTFSPVGGTKHKRKTNKKKRTKRRHRSK